MDRVRTYLVKRKLVKRRSPDGPKLRFPRFTLHERRFTVGRAGGVGRRDRYGFGCESPMLEDDE